MESELEAFDNLAARLRPGVSGSRLQGALAGELCAGGLPATGWMLRLADILQLEHEPDPSEREDLAEAMDATREALEDEDLGFRPVLPDDECALDVRVRALAEWCDAFLLGFAASPQSRDAGPASAESAEMLSDLTSISAGLEVEGLAGDEADEDDFIQIVEFIRLAALSLFLEQARDQAGNPPRSIH